MKKILSLLVLICFFLPVCFSQSGNQKPKIKFLAGAKPGNYNFEAGNGKTYPITIEKGEVENEVSTEAANPPCSGENFDGSDRKKAKLSFSTAAQQTYATLSDLLQTLPADNVMGNHNPAISTGPNSARVQEEQRNVYVKKAWIYTFSREGDEDFHTIIGTTATPTASTTYFNIEVSGLPAANASSSSKIKSARAAFKKFFNLTGSCSGGYVAVMQQPIEIEFKGSLFFDQLHFAGHASIGHGVAKPKTYWEVHPVSFISFH
ncbi:MAG: hypothetical protein ACJ75B_14670 [Flavisolibacter sp.]